MNSNAGWYSFLLSALITIVALPSQVSADNYDSALPCMNGSEQPCWDNLKIGVIGITRPQPVGHIWGSLAYSSSFGGYDSWGLNPAFLADYNHVRAPGFNTDIFDAGFAAFGAPGGYDQISQQIGLEALFSTVNHNADVNTLSTEEKGYTLGFVYRAVIPITDRPPIDIQLRYLHQHLTTATISAEELEVTYLWDRSWPGIFVSYRHDNTPEGVFLIGIRVDFNSDSD